MKLNNRLKVIADNIPDKCVVADIGTDHALIPLYLIQNNICRRCIASDVSIGPINKAKSNISKYNANDQIDIRLGSGLMPIHEDEIDVILIAGMGGLLISQILDESVHKARMARKLILQPMNTVEVLREWLYKNNFVVEKELLADEDYKIYNILVARYNIPNLNSESFIINSELPDLNIDEKQYFYYYIGQKLIEERPLLFKRHLLNKIRQTKIIVEGIKKSKSICITQLKYYSDLIEWMISLDN